MFINLQTTDQVLIDKLTSQAKFNINSLFYEFLLLTFLQHNTVLIKKGIYTLLAVRFKISKNTVKKTFRNLQKKNKIQDWKLTVEGRKYLRQLTFIFEARLYSKF